jgi:hypothetical protein
LPSLRRVLALVALACCALAPSRVASSVAPEIVFEPRWFSMLSSEYVHTGVISYAAAPGVYPRPVPPANGYLACNGGYSVDLQISAGPYVKGRIDDRFVVLPQSARPPKGTILKCSSTWGLYAKTGNVLLGSTTLYATIVYDTGIAPIVFEPAKIALTAGSGPYVGTLAYGDAANRGVRPIPATGGYLNCPGGTAVPLHVAAGRDVGGQVRDTYTIVPSSLVVAPGSAITCSSTWGAYDAAGTLLGQATLEATFTGP